MVVAGVERADVHGRRDERPGTGTDGDGSTAPANTRVSLAARDSRWWSLRPGVGQGDRGSRRYRVRLEHVPQKWEPVLRKRTCSNKELEQDDDSKKSHPALARHFGFIDRPSEAELVTIRISQVEEALAPFRVARWPIRPIAGRNHASIERIDIAMIEDDAPPPGPGPASGLHDQIEKALSRPKAGERRILTAMDDLESQHAIGAHRARHIMGGERHRADAL